MPYYKKPVSKPEKGKPEKGKGAVEKTFEHQPQEPDAIPHLKIEKGSLIPGNLKVGS